MSPPRDVPCNARAAMSGNCAGEIAAGKAGLYLAASSGRRNLQKQIRVVWTIRSQPEIFGWKERNRIAWVDLGLTGPFVVVAIEPLRRVATGSSRWGTGRQLPWNRVSYSEVSQARTRCCTGSL